MEQYTSLSSDRHHVPEITQALAEHDRLVQWVIRRQWLGPLSFSEALQIGRIALWCALKGYDPSRSTQFSTYAVPVIERDIWQGVARAKPHPQEVVTADPPQESPDLEEAVHNVFVREALHRLAPRLPRRLASVIVARYGLDGHSPQTFPAIGRRLGVTKQRAHQLHAEALLWLAHPARSLPLSRLLDCNTVADYQAYLACLRCWQRRRRRKAR